MKFYYYGDFDSNGLSQYLNSPDISLTYPFDDTLSSNIDLLLPKRTPLHHDYPQWMKDNSFNFLDSSTITITYVSGNDSSLNSIAYFIYDTHKPPKTIGHIKECYFFFPNSAPLGSGGALKRGDRIMLAYEFTKTEEENGNYGKIDPTNYVFPAGTSVGFLVYPMGWKGSFVNKYLIPYTSVSKHNPERAQEHKYHTACLLTKDGQGRDRLIMGFEDEDREDSSCYHDFNGLLLVVDTEIAKLGRSFTDPEYFVPSANDPDMPSDYVIGYKKAFSQYAGYIVEVVITLFIPTNSIFMKKKVYTSRLKTNQAYIKEIIIVPPMTTIATTKSYVDIKVDSAFSWYGYMVGPPFTYTRGDMVTSSISDADSTGIYYFPTFEQAAAYDFDPMKL